MGRIVVLDSNSLIHLTDWHSLLNSTGPSKQTKPLRFAPVAPVRLLSQLNNAGRLGNYNLLLAHDVASPENIQAFTELFQSRSEDSFVIMDNSLIELGKPVDSPIMIAACRAVRPNIVVLPDKLQDSYATIEMHKEALSKWAVEGLNSFMAVVQGTYWYEIRRFIETFLTEPLIKMWSVPRVMTDTYGSRTGITRFVHTVDPSRPIHLLGFSDNVTDDLRSAEQAGVLGIDSAVPVRAGLLGKRFSTRSEIITLQMPPRGDYWQTSAEVYRLNEDLQEAVHLNLDVIRHRLNRSTAPATD